MINPAFPPPTPQQAGFSFHGREPVTDLSGLPVTTAEPIWHLNDPARPQPLDWSLMPMTCAGILEPTVSYVAELIKRYSPGQVVLNFHALRLLERSEAFVEADRAGDVIPYKAISQVHTLLGQEGWRTHYLRKWYEWCSDQGSEYFSPEVAFQLREIRIGGNKKGVAVLSMDPESGPLIDTEVEALRNSLRASAFTKTITLQERAALWLCLSLGCNPMQFVLLREEDFKKLETEDSQGALFTLNVPRIKKRHAAARSEFKLRKLVEDIGTVIEELIEENRSRREVGNRSGGGFCAPIFSRELPRQANLDGPLREYSMGWYAGHFTQIVSAAARKLAVISPRTGKLLHVSCRRFRYTYATRLVREGASQRSVAEALDHTDLQHVQCYFDLKSSIVTSVDWAIGSALAPVAQAFLGMVVRTETEAVLGDRPSSRVHTSRPDGNIATVGTCGSFSFCGLYAPVACYTCVRFQAWLDGPHEEVLGHLISERQRRESEGLDSRMVAIHDTTIAAVAEVIQQIASMRDQELSHVA